MKLLGKGVDLLCKRTNMRAKQRLSRCSDAYRKRWKDLKVGPTFDSFFGTYLGAAIIGIGHRHIASKTPAWLSQHGEGRLFNKIPADLFHLHSAHFVAHTHRDSVLFKKSIREQRISFYGNKEFSDIVYENSRNSRDTPNTISGDETITRLYTRKATDIRMRTRKKNESGIMNQNLCGSNEGYMNWSSNHPKASGFTFANMAYPGASYNVGSMFREKDIGNLLQLVFSCGEYYRFKNIELVADSHFGHVLPMIYARF